MRHRLMLKKLLFLIFSLSFSFPAWAGIDCVEANRGTTNSTLDLPNTSVTVSLWVNLDSTSESGAFINFGDYNTPSGDGYTIGVGATTMDDSGNNIIMLFNDVRWIDTNDNIGTGWHHLAFTLNASGYPEIFLDGTSVYSDTTGQARNPDPRYDLCGFLTSTPDDRFVDAEINEIAVWSTILTSREISQLALSRVKRMPYQIQPSSLELYLPTDNSLTSGAAFDHSAESGIALYWDMDTDESPIQDQSANNNDGTLKGAGEPNFVNTDTIYDGAYTFDGVDDYVTVASDLGLNGVSETIMAWVNLDSTSEHGAFIKVGNGSTGYGLGVGSTTFENNGNDLIALFEEIAWIDTDISIGTGWHHVALVINASGHALFYLDGTHVYSYSTFATNDPASNFYVGGYTTNRYVDAVIDEVAIYDSLLTASQINTYYKYGKYLDMSTNEHHAPQKNTTRVSESVLSYP